MLAKERHQTATGPIGKYTTIGSRVSIGGFEHPNNWLSVSEFQYRDKLECYGENGIQDDENEILLMTPTLIGNDVWIGDNTFIKSGTKIGHGSIIGAGSVVTKSVPNYSIYVGNPAKLLRKRFPAEVCQKLLESAWWELSITELKNLDLNYSNIEDCLNKIMKYKSDKFVY
jgi:virginiamycin A acetyltransferase